MSSHWVNGIFMRQRNEIFVFSIMQLCRGEDCEHLVKNGLFHRIYDQYSRSIGMKNVPPPPKSTIFRKELSKRFEKIDLEHMNDRDIATVSMDVARKLMDELFLPRKQIRSVRRRRRTSPTNTVITETTELLSDNE